MTRAAVVLAALGLAALAAGCDGAGDGDSSATTTTTATTPTTTSPGATSVAVYFLRDGKVAPVRRRVPATTAVARAAMRALLAGPTEAERDAGLVSAIPEGTSLRDIALADGVATVDLDGRFDEGGGSASMLGR